MDRTNMRSRALLLFLVLVSVTGSLTAQSADSRATADTLMRVATDILFGRNAETVLPFVAPGARLVAADRHCGLRDVIAGREHQLTVAEDTSRQLVGVIMATDSMDHGAWIVLTTAAPDGSDRRNHSAVFLKHHSERWTLDIWHLPR